MASDIDVVAGNFNGNNRTDLALVRRSPGWNVVPVLLADCSRPVSVDLGRHSVMTQVVPVATVSTIK